MTCSFRFHGRSRIPASTTTAQSIVELVPRRRASPAFPPVASSPSVFARRTFGFRFSCVPSPLQSSKMLSSVAELRRRCAFLPILGSLSRLVRTHNRGTARPGATPHSSSPRRGRNVVVRPTGASRTTDCAGRSRLSQFDRAPPEPTHSPAPSARPADPLPGRTSEDIAVFPLAYAFSVRFMSKISIPRECR